MSAIGALAARVGIESGNTRRIPLSVPIPVLILYWTASTDLHVELHFYRDDTAAMPALLAALDTSS